MGEYGSVRQAIMSMFPEDHVAYGKVLELTDRMEHGWPHDTFDEELRAIIEEAKIRERSARSPVR